MNSEALTPREASALDAAMAYVQAEPDLPLVREIRQKKASATQAKIAAIRAQYAAEEVARFTRCATCGGVGFVRSEAEVGSPLFGKSVPCSKGKCPCYLTIVAERLDKLTLLPGDLVRMKANWKTFPAGVDMAAVENVKAYALNVLKGRETHAGVVIRGKNQIGKTGLAYCVHTTLRKKQIASVFMRCIDLLERLRIAKLDNEDHVRFLTLMGNFANVTHLVLDDLGSEKMSEAREEWLYDLLDQRSKNPDVFTTITTNLDGEALREQMGDRIYARLRKATFYQIAMQGEMNAANGGQP